MNSLCPRIELFGGPMDGVLAKSGRVGSVPPSSFEFRVPAFKWDGRLSSLFDTTRAVRYTLRDGKYRFEGYV